MTDTQVSLIRRALELAGWEAREYPNYSGRGMYGVTTNALVTDCPPQYLDSEIKPYLARELGDDGEAADQLLRVRCDNLGLKYVLY
ncbi:MAG: hypothetical protein D6698_04990 [Gammaproteobacteria bacterium]|nr:MAG: hypothetical protein D6698_04990 [Gammaproteobacteria bacterium]